MSHVIPAKSTLPILSNVLLAADGERLKLVGTNLDLAMSCWIGATVAESGTSTVPAKLLSDYVGGLPNELLTLERDARTEAIRLSCARFDATVKGIEAEAFPTLPTISAGAQTIAFGAKALREISAQVAFAAASDDTRPVLAGVLMRLKGRSATFAAADGECLAFRTLELAEPVAEPIEVIVPARALIELGRIIGDTNGAIQVSIAPSGGQLVFQTAQLALMARLIDGRYPDIERVIPTTSTTRAVLQTQEIAKAVKLASLFATASSNIVRLKLAPSDASGSGRLTISANAAEVGDNTGALDGAISGEGGQIALNVKFLTEAIAAITTPQVALERETPQNPGVFKPVGADGYIHIVMPMSVR